MKNYKNEESYFRPMKKIKTYLLLSLNIVLVGIMVAFWITLIFSEVTYAEGFESHPFSKLNIGEDDILVFVISIIIPSLLERLLSLIISMKKKGKEKNIYIVFETSNQKDFEKFENSLKLCIFSSSKNYKYVVSSSNSIALGENINKKLKKICKETDIYIYLISSSFYKSENCLREMEYISLYSKDALKIPVVIDSTDSVKNMPKQLKDIKYLLLTNIESEKEYTNKINSLAKFLIKKEA